MAEFKYAPMFQLGPDTTEYYRLTGEGVSLGEFEGHPVLKVAPEALTRLANAAFRDVNFLLRPAHNQQVAKILSDPEASDNDKYVALRFLRNAEVARKASCLSARTQARPSSTERRDSRSGPALMTRKPSPGAFTRPTRRRTCATARMLLWTCTRRSTRSATFLPRSTSRPGRGWNTSSSAS